MRWPWSKKEPPTRELKATLGTSHELGSFLIFGQSGSGETPASALNLYEKSTAVSIPINMVAEAFASIEPVIRIGDRNESEHEILDLISNPSPFFTQDLFLETLGKNYLITGESFCAALGNINRPPLELQPITPKDINHFKADNGIIRSFVSAGDVLPGEYKLIIKNKNARYIDGNLREIIQIRNFSTKDNSMGRGQSPLLAASAEARQHIKGNAHNISILDNGGRISLVFHFDEDLSPDEFKEVQARVIEQYGGHSKAGSIGVTAGGKLDIKEMGTTNKDMDFDNLQKTAKIAVSQQYKVPLPLILIDASTFNNYSEAKMALYDNAVLPLADRIFAGLTNLLMPRYGINPADAWITYDIDKITALAKRRNEELKLRKELNLETPNELRKMIGRDPEPNGDVIYITATMVPMGSDLFGGEEDEPRVLRDE